MKKEKETLRVVDDPAEEIPISDYRRYQLNVRGITGVIWNRVLQDMSKTKLKAKSNEPAEEEQRRIWRDKLHLDGQGRVYWPAENVQEAIKGGAQYWGFKIGMKGLTKIIERGIICEPMEIWDAEGNPVYKDSESLIMFEKQVRRADGRIVYSVRPMLPPGWTGSAIVHAWDARLSRDILHTACRMTGQYNGIGDWRKFYGRFEVTGFEEVGEERRVVGA